MSISPAALQLLAHNVHGMTTTWLVTTAKAMETRGEGRVLGILNAELDRRGVTSEERGAILWLRDMSAQHGTPRD